MKKKILTIDQANSLTALAEKYRQSRELIGARPKSYSPELREMALSAVGSGVSVGVVAKAIGVSAESIHSWRRQVSGLRRVRPAKELKLGLELGAIAVAPVPPGLAIIRLKSGVGIELPYSGLTVELLSVLSEVRP